MTARGIRSAFPLNRRGEVPPRSARTADPWCSSALNEFREAAWAHRQARAPRRATDRGALAFGAAVDEIPASDGREGVETGAVWT